MGQTRLARDLVGAMLSKELVGAPYEKKVLYGGVSGGTVEADAHEKSVI